MGQKLFVPIRVLVETSVIGSLFSKERREGLQSIKLRNGFKLGRNGPGKVIAVSIAMKWEIIKRGRGCESGEERNEGKERKQGTKIWEGSELGRKRAVEKVVIDDAKLSNGILSQSRGEVREGKGFLQFLQVCKLVDVVWNLPSKIVLEKIAL